MQYWKLGVIVKSSYNIRLFWEKITIEVPRNIFRDWTILTLGFNSIPAKKRQKFKGKFCHTLEAMLAEEFGYESDLEHFKGKYFKSLLWNVIAVYWPTCLWNRKRDSSRADFRHILRYFSQEPFHWKLLISFSINCWLNFWIFL